jgi:hypothetical protein
MMLAMAMATMTKLSNLTLREKEGTGKASLGAKKLLWQEALLQKPVTPRKKSLSISFISH